MKSIVSAATHFFASWRFPVFVLSLLIFADTVMIGLLLIPPSPTGLGAWAEDFKIWCFGYDPATRTYQWGYVATLFGELLFLGAVIVGVWWRQLGEARRHPRRVSLYAFAALALVASGSAAAFNSSRGTRTGGGEMPFPAERLRTSLPPPSLDLVNQDGARVRLADLQGNVVLMTGVYTSCGFTCPIIMRDAREAVAALEPALRTRLRVVAVTLDPARDDRARLAAMAQTHHVESPLFNLVTGSVADVERTLDDLAIARTRDVRTGVIDHANVFVLVDRTGRVAYRLTIGTRQRRWLASALRLLLTE